MSHASKADDSSSTSMQFSRDQQVVVTGGVGLLWSFVVEFLRQHISKPNCQPRRSLDTSRGVEAFGFKAYASFDKGLRQTVDGHRGRPAAPAGVTTT